jgi:four helix bundle protein
MRRVVRCRLSVVGDCNVSQGAVRKRYRPQTTDHRPQTTVNGQYTTYNKAPETMIAKRFEDLEVYQLALAVQREIFQITRKFPIEERYALTDQIRRSSRSVGANIAEAWHKRRYPAHFASKLTDADAEGGESRHWLQTCLDCEYISEGQFQDLTERCLAIGAKLGHMIQNADQWQPRG